MSRLICLNIKSMDFSSETYIIQVSFIFIDVVFILLVVFVMLLTKSTDDSKIINFISQSTFSSQLFTLNLCFSQKERQTLSFSLNGKCFNFFQQQFFSPLAHHSKNLQKFLFLS